MYRDMTNALLPRSWSLAASQLKRDVVTVGRRLAGHNAPPLVRRGPSASSFAMPSTNAVARTKAEVDAKARELSITRVVRETEDAVTLVLASPAGEAFDFLPGQFFTLLVDDGGETVTRNYSASNMPGTSELHLTIKRKPGGRVSGRLVDASPGGTLRVLGPFGAFTVSTNAAANPRRVVLVAGGSGITPLASIARALLEREPSAEIALVYANRSEGDVILGSALDALATLHAPRMSLHHILEEPIGSALPMSTAVRGRLDRATASVVLHRLDPAFLASGTFYVCGPDGMRDEVLAALANEGVEPARIRVERFAIGPRPTSGPSLSAAHAAALPGARPITIRAKSSTITTVALPGATLLEAGLAAGAPMPFSCGSGGCGACRVRLVSGDVDVEEPSCLDAAERANGYVLTCVGRACGPCEIEIENGGG